MKKILLVLSILIIMFLPTASFHSADPELGEDVHFKKVIIKLDRNKCFKEDYTRNYKGIDIIIRKGTSWTYFQNVKSAIDDMPDYMKNAIKTVIASPNHPEIELANDYDGAKQTPYTSGITDGIGTIAIRDYDSKLEYFEATDLTLYHEAIHNLAREYDILASEEIEKWQKKISTKAKKLEEVNYEYVDTCLIQSDSEEFICEALALYIAGEDNDSPDGLGNIDYQYFIKTYPDFVDYLEKLDQQLELEYKTRNS